MSRFDALSPSDFERLVTDLLSVHYQLPYRSGADGPDGGLDALAIDDDGQMHAVQCKHTVRSSQSQLRAMARAEAKKLEVQEAKLASYLFVTSAALTLPSRKRVADILKPHVARADQVLGAADVERLLNEHPEVERRHVKLWLGNSAQLERALSAATYARSAALLAECGRQVGRWVQTDRFFSARKVLKRDGLCVISGPAGVGKTTLARLLLLDAVAEGAEPIELLRGDLDGAWRALGQVQPTERLIFIFDDFLGETSLAPTQDGDTDILRFLRTVVRTPQSQLILSTREYILQQGQQASEVLATAPELRDEFIVRVGRYTREEKAEILFNHLWASDRVTAEQRQSLRRGRSYLRIIDHPNYNPRVIEWVTGAGGSDVDELDYAEYCLRRLARPDELWAHAFEHGLTDRDRALLLAMLGLPRRVPLAHLETAFESACAARSIATTGRAFRHALRAVEASFVESSAGDRTVTISLLNPSLTDFLVSYVAESGSDAVATVDGAAYFEQVLFLADVAGEAADGHPRLELALLSALIRTMGSAPIYSELSMSAERFEFASRFASTSDRLLTIANAAKKHAFLRRGLQNDLCAPVAAWLGSLTSADLARDSTFRAMTELRRLDTMSRRQCADALLRPLRENSVSNDVLSEFQWYEVLATIISLDPAAVDPENFETWWSDCNMWMQEVLDAPQATLEDEQDVETVRYIAQHLDIPVSSDVLDALVADFEQQREEADHERSLALDEAAEMEYERWRDSRDVDAAATDSRIERLFREL